jgi:peptide/nickel transport system ATP-binding protein
MKEILKVENLSVNLKSNGKVLPVLSEISFSVREGEVVSLVGESGSGKSITAMSITRLIPKNIVEYSSGKIYFEDKDVLSLPHSELSFLRGKNISYIFQDPFTSLNPVKKIKDQIIEPYLLHNDASEKEATEKARYLLNRVGVTDLDERLSSYPGQMSGGILQRICIAMALICEPKLLIADEPTSAIDVTVQAQLMELLFSLRKENNMAILFISHDMGVVSYLADRICVMYAGQIIESGETDQILENSSHPYTRALLDSVPSGFGESKKRLNSIDGNVPSPENYPFVCRFAERCPKVFDRCKNSMPVFYSVNQNHQSRCFLSEGADVRN